MYIKRHIEEVVKRMARLFPSVILSGSRQVGKTTLLRELNTDASYVTLDRLDAFDAARHDPLRFLALQKLPVIIDEVQYAPDLFRFVKIVIDEERSKKGRFFLTGSQRFLMMQGVDESLAGRAGIIEMLGLSLRESAKENFLEPFVPTEAYISKRHKTSSPQTSLDLWDLIVRGDLPELYADRIFEQLAEVGAYYDSFINTYLQRDVSSLAQVGDFAAFNRFMSLAALMHGQQLNKAELAAQSGVSVPTVGRWLSVLEASNIIYFLKPFYANSKKRLVKTPKLYFLNSGLAAHLCRINSGSELEHNTFAGAFFEGFVLAEILKSHLNARGFLPDLYYYRDSNRNEIDILLADGPNLYPIEVKKATSARNADCARFALLDEMSGYVRQSGAVICNCPEPLPLSDNNWALPVRYL